MIKAYSDYMIDLETLGTTTDSAILSIGVAPFKIVEGGIVEPEGFEDCFYTRISLTSVILTSDRFNVDQGTVAWWRKQNDAAKSEIISGHFVSIQEALKSLTDYINTKKGGFGSNQIRVWGNASSFDVKILEHAYRVLGLNHPWSYRSETDYRTLKALFSNAVDWDKVPESEAGVHHHALDDALSQVRTLKLIVEALAQKGVQLPVLV